MGVRDDGVDTASGGDTSGDDSCPGLYAPAWKTVLPPFPLVSPSGPLNIDRMFLL